MRYRAPSALAHRPLCLLIAAAIFISNVNAEDLDVLLEVEARHEAVHAQVAPAVVGIQTRKKHYGAGVLVSPGGLILSSSAIFPADTESVEVYFADGRVMNAKVLATHAATESCVLQIVHKDGDKPLAFPFVELADSTKATVGELAYSAGNPLYSISQDGQVAWSVGTISGIYKIASADESSRYSGVVLETDSAVNPGSQGGPLFDSNGRLLGILSLCFCESRWLGTAVPVHLVKPGLAAALRDVPMVDPRMPPAVKFDLSRQTTLPSAETARAIPNAMRAACRPAINSLVKLQIKRVSDDARGFEKNQSLVRRLRQRPACPVTGVMIEADGYIITSAFNIDADVSSIQAVLSDGTILPATVLGRHLGLDVALLKVVPPRGEMLPCLSLSPDPDVKIGKFVSILGASEEGPAPTHTLGIVSARGRLDGASVAQTDALVNYGNSGGPVIDLRGRLVGIATQINPKDEWGQQNSGVGFFAMSDKIIASLPDLKASREIKGPSWSFLGIQPENDNTEFRGVKLEQVVPGSAAAAAGLQPGDIILAADKVETHSWVALMRLLKSHEPGDVIELNYQRGSIKARTRITLTVGKDVR